MVQYLKNLLQLVLLPFRGWEDVSATLSDPERLLRDGYYPLLGIAANTEFVRLFYHGHGGFSMPEDSALHTPRRIPEKFSRRCGPASV